MKQKSIHKALRRHLDDGIEVQKLISKIGKIILHHDQTHGKGNVCAVTRLHALAGLVNQLGMWELWSTLPMTEQAQFVRELIDNLNQGRMAMIQVVEHQPGERGN